MGDRSEGDGLPEMSSINHDPCYHELKNLSNTIIVLVFSELASFVRKILQREENKGVELTVHRGNGLWEGSSESKRKKKKRQLPHPRSAASLRYRKAPNHQAGHLPSCWQH